MIKSQKELMLINLIGFISSGVSYIFTILMLMSFAETNLEKVLYFLCGVINDGMKWFSLITLIKYYRAKFYKNFIVYCFLFFLFFTMSLVASISYSVFTVKKQMYDVKIIQNNNFINVNEQIDKLKIDIINVESDKTNELNRINTELDGLPLDYITRRKELADKKIELTNFYDIKINNLSWQLSEKIKELENIDGKEIEEKVLKNNAIANFFLTISNVTKTNIDNIILIFAISLGVILDMASIALTFDSSFSYQNKRAFNSDITKIKTMRTIKKELDKKIDDEGTKDYRILNYNDFVNHIKKYNLDFEEIKFSNFKELMSKNNFFNYYYKYKKEFEKSLELEEKFF